MKPLLITRRLPKFSCSSAYLPFADALPSKERRGLQVDVAIIYVSDYATIKCSVLDLKECMRALQPVVRSKMSRE